MYVLGQGHEHLGPGTSMVQFTKDPGQALIRSGGLGCAGGCMSELAPDRALLTQFRGMGCGCKQTGLGLFDGGLDPSTWGVAEYAVVGVGLLFVFGQSFRQTRSDVRGARERVSGAIEGARRPRRRRN